MGRLARNTEDGIVVSTRQVRCAIVPTAVAAILTLGLIMAAGCSRKPTAAPDATAHAEAPSTDSVEITDGQIGKIKVEQIPLHTFIDRRSAVGLIDFNADRTVQVFATYPGRILSPRAKAGDDVKAGAILFSVDSPDLAAAESTLIGAAATRELTRRALERAEGLYKLEGYAQKDYEQAVADEKTADGAYRAARDAVRIFGKSDAEIDRIIATRKVDAVMPVRSPITGRVVARNAAEGVLVQPGAAPAPYTVADISTMWLLASVTESDLPAVQPGQPVDVRVQALAGRTFHGKVTNVSAGVDPSTHHATVRAEVADPQHELRSQMLATFAITTGAPRAASGIPVTGVVREGDGTMTVWVTTDRRKFTHRTVTLGLEQDGYVEITSGVKSGELVATDGALFLSNALTEAAR